MSTEGIADHNLPTHPVARPQNTVRFFGQLIADRYRIEGLIARGGMGHVYKGTELDVDRPIAIKILSVRDDGPNDRYRKRFHREASIASRLAHQNIVTIYDYGTTRAGDHYMVMERVEGQSLSDLLQGAGALSVPRAVGISIQIARALRKAHHEGVMHRDLKPDNIMVTPDDEGYDFVKVLDFGLVKVFAPQTDQNTVQLTQAGMLMGTPAYMAPEQALGEEVDNRTDIYSLGILLFQMLAGRLPFTAPSVVELVNMHLIRQPPLALLWGCPRELVEIVAKCLAKAPEDRYATIDEVLSALKRVGRRLTEETADTDPTIALHELQMADAVLNNTLERAAEPCSCTRFFRTVAKILT